MKKWFSILLCLLLFPPVCIAEGQNSSDQLREIKARIEQTSENLDEQKNAEKDLLRDLTLVGTTIKQIDKKIKLIKREEQKISEGLKKTRLELQQAENEVKGLERQVNKRLVALYKEGESGALKLFFSSDSPMEVVQQYQYLSLVLEHDRALLDSYRKGIEKKRDKSRHYEQQKIKQEKLLAAEQKNKADAAQGRALYNEILRRVRKDKNKLAKELKSLEDRAKRLGQLVRKLETEPLVHPKKSQKSFVALKGGLPWPISGSVSVGYGRQHSEVSGSVLESHGIEIAFKEPQEVKAVATGRIVFASWFKGYGNLIIIAHDDGYHTLYAQVDQLQGEVGDPVSQGQVIAKTGVPQSQGLYFEIRNNGSPIDPMSWLVPR